MNIWDRLFGTRPAGTSVRAKANHQFGRYTDAHKGPDNYAAWDAAMDAFEEGDFLDSLEHFLSYLRKEDEDNVKWRRRNGELYFELYQGSKRATGRADAGEMRVSARIARLENEREELLRRLMAMNYSLRYGRYALDAEDHLTIIFDTAADDASPHKLYHALEELALRADKQDDLLLDEFPGALSPAEITHLEAIPAAEKEVKLAFLRQRSGDLLDYLEQDALDAQAQPAAVSYLLLDAVYRLDYLLAPEGPTMEALERMHRMYFAHETDRSAVAKNARLRDELTRLYGRAPADFGEELYRGRSTFGITVPAGHAQVRSLIADELPNMDWYQDNGYPRVALAVPGYLVGYLLFNFAPPPPDRELLHLYFRIVEDDYFRQLGYKQALLRDGRPQRRAIRNEINGIVERYRTDYPELRFPIGSLIYDSLPDFCRSYLEAVAGLDV